jgi:hypothetical protein
MWTLNEILGYLGSALVLSTFAVTNPRRLRSIAMLSNVAFIAYGALVWLPPVLTLHLLLLPLNAYRLAQLDANSNPGRAISYRRLRSQLREQLRQAMSLPELRPSRVLRTTRGGIWAARRDSV